MKRHLAVAGQLVIAFLLLSTFTGCLKDNCSHTYVLYTPVYKTLSEVRANIKSSAPKPLESTGKIYLYGNYIFLNEPDKGIHIIDNSKPAHPKNISFIPIPGNVDMAVKGNTLYADCYSDLVTLDISNPQQVTAKGFLDNIFPHRNNFYVGNSSNPDSVKVVAEYLTRDTTVDCDTYKYLYNTFYVNALADFNGNFAAPKSSGGAGIGGSMARFTLVNDYLYAVTNNDLNVINVSTPQTPAFTGTKNIGWGIETIYPFKDKLFIGSTTGMFIYDVSDPASPTQTGQFSHVRSCDPVIADDNHAYVTLNSAAIFCQGTANQLDVLDINNLSNPKLLRTYSMASPHGLSKDGNLLFICDGTAGLKIYNASNPLNHELVKNVHGMETYDVIAWNKIALVVAREGLYQFDYSNPEDIRLVSKMELKK